MEDKFNCLTKIGAKIKEIRESKGLSAEEVVERAGVDPAFYSLVEKNEEVPAVGDLLKVSRVLGVRLSTLLDDQQNCGAVVARHLDIMEKPSFSFKGGHSDNSETCYYPICANKANRNMDCYKLVVTPFEGKRCFSSHEGEEFLYVLDGEAEIQYGKQSYNLSEGDTIYFDSVVPHSIASASKTESVSLLSVMYIPL